MEAKNRAKVVTAIVMISVVCFYNSFRGIALKQVSGDFVRGSTGQMHTGRDAEIVGAKWLIAGILIGVAGWWLDRYIKELD